PLTRTPSLSTETISMQKVITETTDRLVVTLTAPGPPHPGACLCHVGHLAALPVDDGRPLSWKRYCSHLFKARRCWLCRSTAGRPARIPNESPGLRNGSPGRSAMVTMWS